MQRRAERHAARLNYVGRYYDTKSITLPSLTGTGGEDRYDDYKPTTVRVCTCIPLRQPLARETGFQNGRADSLLPPSRFSSSLGFDTVAHSPSFPPGRGGVGTLGRCGVQKRSRRSTPTIVLPHPRCP